MFADVEESQIANMMDEKDSVSTQRTVKRSVNLFRSFLIEKRGSGEFEGLSKQELNENLRLFYVSIRKKTGTNLKVNSLNNIKYGLSKYLKGTCKIDIQGPEFNDSNEVYKAALTDMKKKGFGFVDHKPAISSEDLKKLYNSESIVFNVDTPWGLQNKVWFDIKFYLCRRGGENLRRMTKETFVIKTDATGREYVFQAIDEVDKNHGSNAAPNETIGEERMYAQPHLESMCPVNSFRKYLSKLHMKLDALWQRPVEAFSEESTAWYCSSPLGKNTLACLMSEISKKAKLSRIYTNHSIRATTITALDQHVEAEIEARHIMHATEERNESSIRCSECLLDQPKEREMSHYFSSSLGTVCRNPTQTHMDQENSRPSLKQEHLDAVFNDSTFDEFSSSSSSQQQEAKDEERPPQVLYRCGEEYFMHQVSSTTSPPYQIPLIGTPPELPRPISEGSAEGASQSFISTSSNSTQESISGKTHAYQREQPPSPPIVQQQVILDLTNTVIKCETEPIHAPSNPKDIANEPKVSAKCKIFEISKFLRMQIQDKTLIHVRRSNVLSDVLKIYQRNPEIVQRDFNVCFEEHSRDNDVCHVPLSPHALFVQFWREAFAHFFAGNQESVPIIDVSIDPDFYKTLGQILYHGLILLDYWPVKLSQACACVMILNTCSDRQLLTSLHRTMSDQERFVITEAKREIRSGCSEFSMQTTKSLYQVLRLYGNTQRPRPGNLEQLLLQMSNFYLKQKSYWALYEMRSGLQSFISDFLSHLEEQDVFSFYSLLTPNALSLFEKTIYMFSATDNSIHEMEEKRVKMYFENFVMKLNCETLSTLLVKWCYSDCLCMEHLYVRFLANSISERPHFDPNETTLTLSSVYTSQEELHQLMMSELES